MCAIRVYKKQFDLRLDYIQHGWVDNNQRLIGLSKKIHEISKGITLDPTTVRQILESNAPPSGKKQLLGKMSEGVKPLSAPLPTLLSPSVKKAKTRETPSPHPMNPLPDVLVRDIYSYFPCRERARLSRVSYSFYCNYLPSCIIDLKRLPIFDPREIFDFCKALQCHPFDILVLQENVIETLVIAGVSLTQRAVDVLDSERVLPALTRITTVNFNFSDNIDKYISIIAKKCCNLQKLRVSARQISPVSYETIAKHCKTLVELEILNPHITDQRIQLIAEGCPLLKKLSLSGFLAITAASMRALTACPNLIGLCLPLLPHPLTANDFHQFILAHPALEHIQLPLPLSLKDCPALSQSCPSLRTVETYYGDDHQMPYLKTLLLQCQKLEELSYHEGAGSLVGDGVIATISQHGHHLKRLNFRPQCKPSSPDTLRRLFLSLPNCDISLLPLWPQDPLHLSLDPQAKLVTMSRINGLQVDWNYIPQTRGAAWVYAYQKALRNPDSPSIESLENEMVRPFRDMAANLDPVSKQSFSNAIHQLMRQSRFGGKIMQTLLAVNPQLDSNLLPATLLFDALHSLELLPSSKDAPF
jgi:hypothetical protein